MGNICYPTGTDWSTLFPTQSELDDARDHEVKGPAIETAEEFAWSLLAALAGYQIGTCPIRLRPCAARCAPASTWLIAPVSGAHLSALPVRIGMFNPYISHGIWYNACGCGSQGDACSCGPVPTVELPGPVGKIESVTIDGVILPDTAYRVDNGTLLVRQDGESWPLCQDMADSTPAFEVVYYRGAAPNAMTRAAAGSLAVEFYKALTGNECRLPSNMTRATQGGNSYEFSPMDFPEGDTGGSFPLVDAVIRIFNPNRLKAPVEIVSPETLGIGGRVTTWRRR